MQVVEPGLLVVHVHCVCVYIGGPGIFIMYLFSLLFHNRCTIISHVYTTYSWSRMFVKIYIVRNFKSFLHPPLIDYVFESEDLIMTLYTSMIESFTD